jgi:hypothetical protein
MTKQEEKILDKYQKHCLNIRQKFSTRERRILNNVFRRAMENLAKGRNWQTKDLVNGWGQDEPNR